MTPDEIHDYEYQLHNAVERLNGDTRLRAADRKLILAFLAHIKAQDVSTGRLAKYVNMLHTASATRTGHRRRVRLLRLRLSERPTSGPP